MANVNRQWVLAKRPHGKVGKANYEYREGRIPKPGDGKVLVKNRYLSFDPTQRGWMEEQVARPVTRRAQPERARLVREPALRLAPRIVVDEARDAALVRAEARERVEAAGEVRGREGEGVGRHASANASESRPRGPRLFVPPVR